MVDEFLSRPATATYEYLSSHKQYQLLSITALYTTIKVRESVAIGPDVFSVLSNGLYSQQEIEDMELTLLMGLKWQICTPTSLQVAYHILSLIGPRVSLSKSTWSYLLDEVLFQTEYAVRDHELSAMSRPSTVALASILNALGEVNDSKARKAILRALLFVIQEFGGQLASPGELLSTRNRLQTIIPTQADCQHDGNSIEHEGEQQEEESFMTTRRPDPSYTDVREYGRSNDGPPRYISFEPSSPQEER